MKTIWARLLIPLLSSIVVAVLVLGITFFAHVFWQNKSLIWLLPIAGFFLGKVKRLPSLAHLGEGDRVWSEMHQKDAKPLPFMLSTWILFGSFCSHLFGASVGREGAAVQVGAIVADSGQRFFSRFQKSVAQISRIEVLQLGIMAGFCVAFDTPIAALVFAIESTTLWTKPARINTERALWLLPATVAVFYFKKIFSIHYYQYPLLPNADINSMGGLNWILFTGVCLAIVVLYEKLLYGGRAALKSYPKHWVLMGAGFVLAIFVWISGTADYQGLGENLIHSAFLQEKIWTTGFLKLATTLVSLAAGYMGGEVVPLMGAGGSFGQLGADFFSLGPLAIAAGTVMFFSYRLRAPIACLIFLLEKLCTTTGWQNSFIYLLIPFAIQLTYIRWKHPDSQH